MAFQVWLVNCSTLRSPPQQLPIVLQVLQVFVECSSLIVVNPHSDDFAFLLD